jgi:hypothetical protein
VVPVSGKDPEGWSATDQFTVVQFSMSVDNKDEGQAKEAELFQQIGRLQMELEWLKKKTQQL